MGRAGLHSFDLEVGKWLRKHTPDINIVVAMNKSESLFDNNGTLLAAALEAQRLGFGDPVPISAETGLGMQDIYWAIKPVLEKYMLKVINGKKCTYQSIYHFKYPGHYQLPQVDQRGILNSNCKFIFSHLME